MKALVIGGGITGLVSAKTLIDAGYQVSVLEAAPVFGGMIASSTLGGVVIDTGAEAFSPSPAMVNLAAELGLEVAAPVGSSTILWRDPEGAWPLANGILGIPCSLDDPAVTGALTGEQITRLAEDLEMDPQVAADAPTVGELVARRMGEVVVERLVSPLARNVYGADPYDMPTAQYAGFLVKLMAQHGSLMKAISAARPAGQPALVQPVGGMYQMIDRLVATLAERGASLMTDTPATAVRRDEGSWVVETGQTSHRADRLVITAPAAVCHDLVAGLGIDFVAPPTRVARQVMVVLNHPGLAANPIGTGVLVGQHDGVGAKAMTHYSAKWSWVRQAGVEVLRLAYPDQTAAAPERALADASAFTGLDFTSENLVDFLAVNWENMPKALSIPSRAALSAQVATHPGLSIIGAWVSGNSLAGVVWQASKVEG